MRGSRPFTACALVSCAHTRWSWASTPSSRCSPIPTSLWTRLLSTCWPARRHPMPSPSSRHRSTPSTPGIPWRARAGRLAPAPPLKAWCATCWSYRVSCRAAWTMCAWRAARPIPRHSPMPIARRWVRARPRPRRHKWHSTPSTRLRRAAKPWRMRRDS